MTKQIKHLWQVIREIVKILPKQILMNACPFQIKDTDNITQFLGLCVILRSYSLAQLCNAMFFGMVEEWAKNHGKSLNWEIDNSYFKMLIHDEAMLTFTYSRPLQT